MDWQLSIDSTVSRVHQHGLNMTRQRAAVLPSYTGGPLERQQTTRSSRTLRPARHRLRRDSAGGRPVSYNTERYKDRNVIERSYEQRKQWRGLATR